MWAVEPGETYLICRTKPLQEEGINLLCLLSLVFNSSTRREKYEKLSLTVWRTKEFPKRFIVETLRFSGLHNKCWRCIQVSCLMPWGKATGWSWMSWTWPPPTSWRLSTGCWMTTGNCLWLRHRKSSGLIPDSCCLQHRIPQGSTEAERYGITSGQLFWSLLQLLY